MCQACRAAGATHNPKAMLTKSSPQERRFIRRLARELARVLKQPHEEIVDVLRRRDINLTSRGSIRLAIEEAFEQYGGDIDATVTQMHVGGAEVGREVAIQRHALDISMNLTRQEVIDTLQSRALTMSQQTRDRMVGDIAEALADAYQQGMSIDDIADILQDDVFTDMRGYEAERVARTNVISGSNTGAHEAYRDAGAPGKEWIATNGPRTRMTHRQADGQVVLFGDKFVVGGHRADHPGDPALPVGEIVNCRCTVAPVFAMDRLTAAYSQPPEPREVA